MPGRARAGHMVEQLASYEPRAEGNRSVGIEVRGLEKIFLSRGEPVPALMEMHLSVEPGEFLCVIGPSGCGKSTLLRAIGGLEKPTGGSVAFHDSEGPATPRIAFIFQEYGVFPWLTVAENAEFGLRMEGVAKEERRGAAASWLRRVGLEEFARSYPEELSGGMKQRLALARAFAMEPDILLMDEPFGALDAETRNLLQEDLLLLWEKSGKTVVLVTHSIEEAILLGDKVVVMTDRPARIKNVYEVLLTRPRTTETVSTAEFGRLHAGIWDALRTEVQAALSNRKQ